VYVTCITIIGVVSVVIQYMVYNCVYCCDTCYIPEPALCPRQLDTRGPSLDGLSPMACMYHNNRRRMSICV
jgi:hypothetical protein